MNRIIFALPITAAFLVFTGVTAQMIFAGEESNMSALSGNKKVLVAYFSHTGNTREIANQIHRKMGGDIFEIQTVAPYTNDYDALLEQAKKELDSAYKPTLKTRIENISSYDVVFIGYPIWYSTFPAPVRTFLSEYDFSGKTIVPFCTHEGSGLGNSVADISKLCPKATLLDGIAIHGRDVKTAQDRVFEWLRKINITK